MRPPVSHIRARRILAPLLFAAVLAGCAENPDPLPRPLPDGSPVVLVVIDTLRADHLGCYGYELDTSPNLDAFAAEATVFEENATQVNTTHPSLTSILTGLYGKNHGSYVAVPAAGLSAREDVVGVAERLGDRGYEALAVVSHPYIHLAPEGVDPLPGWGRLSTLDGVTPDERVDATRADHANERAFELLDERGDDPLLLWVHYFDPHTDGAFWYDAPEETRHLFLGAHLEALGVGQYEDALSGIEPRDRRGWIRENVPAEERSAVRIANGRALYDAEIRYCDARFGALLERLRADGIYDDAVIAVLADHGENLEGRSGADEPSPFTHHGVYESVSHVPLVLKVPGWDQPPRVSAVTQNIDLLPTLLELLDVPIDPPVDGRSLVPLLAGEVDTLHDRVVTESSSGKSLGLKTERHKLIRRERSDESLIFDWREDPGEETDLYEFIDERVRAVLEDWAREFAVQPGLRVRVHPAPDLGPLELEMRTRPDTLVEIEGPRARRNDEGNRLVWTLEPEDEPVEIAVLLETEMQEVAWRLRRPGDDELIDRIRVGGHALDSTSAVPLLRPVPGRPVEPVVLDVARTDDPPRVRVQVAPPHETSVELQLRFRWPHRRARLSLLEADGWSPKVLPRQISQSLTTGDPLLALVDPGPEDHALLVRARIDGRWPDREHVRVDGGRLPLDEVEFLFTYPPDARLQAKLGSAPDPDPPPGTIEIWSTTVTGGELDAALLDPEVAKELEALGYIDSDGGGVR